MCQRHQIGWQLPDDPKDNEVIWTGFSSVLCDTSNLTVQRRNRKRWFLERQSFNYLFESRRQRASAAFVIAFVTRQSDQTILAIARYPPLCSPVRNPRVPRNLC